MTVDLLLSLECTLDVLRRRGWTSGWTNAHAGTLDGADPVSLVTAIEIAVSGRSGRAGGVVDEAYKATVIALARLIARRAIEAGRPPPLLTWSIRLRDPSWVAAERFLETWDVTYGSWPEVQQVLRVAIDELGAQSDEPAGAA